MTDLDVDAIRAVVDEVDAFWDDCGPGPIEPDQCGIPGHTVQFCTSGEHGYWPCDQHRIITAARQLLDALAERDAEIARLQTFVSTCVHRP